MSNSQKKPQLCQICDTNLFKYSCPRCQVVYCSVGCYRQHKAASCTERTETVADGQNSVPRYAPGIGAKLNESEGMEVDVNEGASGTVNPGSSSLPDPPTLRPLSSLRWPYVPEEPSYPDPLAQQEAKPLQLPQYESIATSVKVRQALEGNTGLKTLLRKIDSMDGAEREMELERVLGVTGDKAGDLLSDSEAADVESLRLLAEAIEEAVRGKKDDYVGLDWTAGHD